MCSLINGTAGLQGWFPMAKESQIDATVTKGSMNLWSEMELQTSITNSWKNVSNPDS